MECTSKSFVSNGRTVPETKYAQFKGQRKGTVVIISLQIEMTGMWYYKLLNRFHWHVAALHIKKYVHSSRFVVFLFVV